MDGIFRSGPKAIVGVKSARTRNGSIGRFVYRLLRGAPFKTEGDKVEGSEWILRRVPREGDPLYYDPTQDKPLQRVAFRPNRQDTDGLSLFRESFISSRQLAMTGGKPPYHIVRLKACRVCEIGLTVVAAPDPDQPPGHVIIPELCFRKSESRLQKEQANKFQLALRDVVDLKSSLFQRHSAG